MNLRAALSVASLVLLASVAGCSVEAPGQGTSDVVATKDDAAVKKAIEEAAAGAIFVSESDEPFRFVSSTKRDGDTKTISQELVRTHFAGVVDADEDADRPMADLVAQTVSFAEWKRGHEAASCTEDSYPGPAECEALRKLDAALQANLDEVTVFYFGARGVPGAVEGVAVSVFLVGRTKSGNYAGVRSLAIWT